MKTLIVTALRASFHPQVMRSGCTKAKPNLQMTRLNLQMRKIHSTSIFQTCGVISAANSCKSSWSKPWQEEEAAREEAERWFLAQPGRLLQVVAVFSAAGISQVQVQAQNAHRRHLSSMVGSSREFGLAPPQNH